jgi:hypothetical protein
MRRSVFCPLPCTLFYNGVVLALVGPFALVALQNRSGKIFRLIGRRYLQEAQSFSPGDRITLTYNSPFGPAPATCKISKVTRPPARLPWATGCFTN